MKLDNNSHSQFSIQLINEAGKFDFASDIIKPLTFSDLEIAKGHDNPSFNLSISTSFVDMSSIGEDFKGATELFFPITFHKKPKIFALINGGWLPPAFVAPPNFLVDRNVVSGLSKVSNGSIRSDYKSNIWWLKFPTLSNVSINPVLYAFEGSNQKGQTFREFHASFKEASEIIAKTLPNATILKYSDAEFEIVYGFITNAADRHEREIKFLVSIAPILVNRCSDNKLDDCRKNILEKSDLYGLNRKSLVVLLALSCLYEPKDGKGLLAAREILKPNNKYSDKDAFNSISDLRALDISIRVASLKPRYFMCTCDRGLAGFWTGLNLRNIRWNGDDMSYDMTIDVSLFPRLKMDERTEYFLFQ